MDVNLRRKAPECPKRPLMWLIRTPRCYSRRTSLHERRIVNSHVQRDFYQKAKQSARERLKYDRPAYSWRRIEVEELLAQSPVHPSFDAAYEWEVEVRHHIECPLLVDSSYGHGLEKDGPCPVHVSVQSGPSSRKTNARHKLGVEGSLADPGRLPSMKQLRRAEDHRSAALAQSRRLLITAAFNPSAIDPFTTGPIKISRDMDFDIHSCVIFIPRIFRFKVMTEDTNRIFVASALTEPAVLPGVMAFRTIYQLSLMKSADERQRLQRKLIRYKIDAIQTINKSLQKPEGNLSLAMIWAVMAILHAEMVEGSSAVLAHQRGLKRMLALRGGLHGLPPTAVDTVLRILHWASLWSGDNPAYLPLKSASALSPQTIAFISIHLPPDLCPFGTSLLEPPIFQHLSSPTITIVQDIRTKIHFREVFRSHESAILPSELDHVNNLAQFLRYNLLALSRNGTPNPFEESILLALTIFAAVVDEYSSDPASPILRILVPRLQSSLQKLERRGLWNSNTDAVLWMLCVGAFSSAEQLEYAWFVGNVESITADLGLNDFESLRSVLLGFCYLDRYYRDSCWDVWRRAGSLDG